MRPVALVTGGGSGIGRGIALALARRGYDLALVGRRTVPLEAVAQEARALGARAVALPADLAGAEEPARVIAHARREVGPIDVLVNNAAVLNGGALAGLAPEEIEHTVALNVTAPLLLTRLALPDLVARRGAVVLVASMASFTPLPFASVYSATKAGLRGFGRSLRYELEGSGVRLLVAYPPGTDTDMVRGMVEAAGLPRGWGLASPEAVGERIVARLEAGADEVFWLGPDRVLAWCTQWAPWLVRLVVRLQRNRVARVMAAGRRVSR